MFIEPGLIEAIAAELVVDPALVEKDWYAMRIMAAISAVKHPRMQLVFSGGTSLAKGYGLIQRFSEDIDFKVVMPQEGVTRPGLREFRGLVVAAIRAGSHDWSLAEADIQSRAGSRFFQCGITYQHQFGTTSALRPQVKLEVTFDSPALPYEERSLRSFVAQAQQQEPEVPSMPCVSPVETAADKLSALVWRVAARDRQSLDDDPTLIRHLHDLAALKPIIAPSQEFAPLVRQCLSQDAKRDKQSGTAELPATERLGRMLQILKDDPLYAKEYQRFVVGMSYAADAERTSFEQALQAIKDIISRF